MVGFRPSTQVIGWDTVFQHVWTIFRLERLVEDVKLKRECVGTPQLQRPGLSGLRRDFLNRALAYYNVAWPLIEICPT